MCFNDKNFKDVNSKNLKEYRLSVNKEDKKQLFFSVLKLVVKILSLNSCIQIDAGVVLLTMP